MRPLNEQRRFSRHEIYLVLIFLCSLPLVNPWVRGDGVGYYAYARAPLIQHNLRFEKDWLAGNITFRIGKTDDAGSLRPDQYTRTGHLDNHFTVGPAILWAPFLLAAHGGVLAADALGAHIPADGFSAPYTITMALATALYGFLGLLLSFHIARKFFDERWAFLGTTGIWLASSLPVYMYFNPSWSHAHSAFAVALFFWYWLRTRGRRGYVQWMLLGASAGLLFDVYFPNGILLLIPLAESLAGYAAALRAPEQSLPTARRLFGGNLLFLCAAVAASLPSFLTRKIVYGGYFDFGSYAHAPWNWTAPQLWSVLFSADHGLLSWTPILILAIIGLFLLRRRDAALSGYLLLGFFAFYYLIACYPFWDGLSSYGNRFFVSLAPIFVLGLTAFLDALARRFRESRTALRAATAAVALFAVWNLGFIFQWGTHMIPVRGPISWRQMAYNQVAVVPIRLADNLKTYLSTRREMMKEIEQKDLKQLESQESKGKKSQE